MNPPKVSIIVPVYNVEKYICRCLDSVVSQTFTDWECILVDDGSLDNSGKVCDEYAERDRRFKVIHRKNSGVSAARNMGLDMAEGEWISFVDSDDWIEKETYKIAIENAIKEKSDVVCYGMRFLQNGRYKSVPFKEKCDIFYKFQHYKVYMHSPCNKLIKGGWVKNKRFNVDMKCYEDLLFIFDVLTDPNIRISYMNNELYYYEQNNSYSSRFLVLGDSYLNSIIQLRYGIFSIYKKKSLEGRFAKKYFEYIDLETASPYISNIKCFDPVKFRSLREKWNFKAANSKMIIQLFFVYLCFDHIAYLICNIRSKIKEFIES